MGNRLVDYSVHTEALEFIYQLFFGIGCQTQKNTGFTPGILFKGSNLNGSLLFDRDGNLLEDTESTASTPPHDEDEASASDLDDNSSMNLPDYDDALDKAPGKAQAEALESEDLPDDFQDAEPGLEIEDLENESTVDQENSEKLEADDGNELIDDFDDLPKEDDIEDLSVDELTDIDLESEDKETKGAGQDIDDDISDILQESRNFWEKKK